MRFRTSFSTSSTRCQPGSAQGALVVLGGTVPSVPFGGATGCAANKNSCSARTTQSSLSSEDDTFELRFLSSINCFNSFSIMSMGGRRTICCCLRRCILCHRLFLMGPGTPCNPCTQLIFALLLRLRASCSRRRSAVILKAATISETRVDALSKSAVSESRCLLDFDLS